MLKIMVLALGAFGLVSILRVNGIMTDVPRLDEGVGAFLAVVGLI